MSIQRVFLILLAAVLLPASAFAQTRATFSVNKTFADDNDITPLTYNISCNTGVPLNQSQVAAAGDFAVEFVVEAFDQGQLDCRVWETEAAGYTASYEATSAFALDVDAVNEGDTQGCFFGDIDSSNYESGDMNVCDITNTPNPVTISVTKDWVIDNLDSGDALDSEFSLTLSCDNGDDDQIQGSDGTSDQTFTFGVIPDWDGGTNCSVDEDVFDSAIEVDNGCNSLHIDINQGDSCTVTNTVFFEGIPTLSQYGMAIMALLMLGVGFVGFRRFV